MVEVWASCILGLDCIRTSFKFIRLPVADVGDSV